MKRMHLATLLGDMNKKQFLNDYWDLNKPLISKGPLKRFGNILSIAELHSVKSLCEVWRTGEILYTWAPKSIKVPILTVSGSEALKLYQSGFTLFFQNVEKSVLALQPLLRSLEVELGLLPGEMYCEAFASPKGTGARPHFDSTSTFNLQISGSKHWELAENLQVLNPPASFMIGSDASALEPLIKSSLPTRMPRAQLVGEAYPGTVVFVPQGVWHRTQALSESFALCFTVSPNTWGKVVMNFLSKQLPKSRASRKNAISLLSRKGQRAGQKEITEVMSELLKILNSCSPQEIVDFTVGKLNSSFQLIKTAKAKLSYDSNEQIYTFKFHTGKAKEVRVIDDEFARMVTWILRHKKKFSLYKMCGKIDQSPDFIFAHLMVLVSVGVLEKTPNHR